MPFTDRFIKLPVRQLDAIAKSKGESKYFSFNMEVLPLEIAAFVPAIDEEFPDDNVLAVTLKNGVQFYVFMGIREFKEALNKKMEG